MTKFLPKCLINKKRQLPNSYKKSISKSILKMKLNKKYPFFHEMTQPTKILHSILSKKC